VHAETLWQTASDVSTNEKEKIPPSKWQRFKQNKTRMAIVIGMVVLAVVAAIAVPLVMMSMEKRFIDQNKVLPPPPKVDEKIQDPDAVRPNNFTPPLNEPFPYGKQPIRGINLGGWLVLEPFITPHVFENSVTNGTVKDEWELCERLGPDKAKETLENHYKSFITEEDFKKMAEMGFNHVRIPLGHWSVRVFPGEPFVPHVSWDYLLKGLEWARKYGLRVMVELHTAPGSQNGWNHSGREGKVGWLDGTKQGETYAQDTVGVVSQIVEYFNKPQYANVVTLFGVLNEPAMMKIPKKRVRSWYDTSYKAIRKILGYGKGPLLTYHDGFAPLEEWEGFFTKDYERVILGKKKMDYFWRG
jgi:glucan 1,3-beta-glucosidase